MNSLPARYTEGNVEKDTHGNHLVVKHSEDILHRVKLEGYHAKDEAECLVPLPHPGQASPPVLLPHLGENIG